MSGTSVVSSEKGTMFFNSSLCTWHRAGILSWSGLVGQVHNFIHALVDFCLLALLSVVYGFHSCKVPAAAPIVLFFRRKKDQ